MGKDRTRRGALVGRAFDEDEGFLGRVRSDGSRPIPDTEAQKKKTTNESTKKTDDFTLRSQQRTARGGQHLEQQKNVHRRRGTD